LPDDDHALQGGAAGDRLPGDGERPVLRRHRRGLRHADGDRVRHRARRAGRHAGARRVLLPDPRALRLARHAPPGKAEGPVMPAEMLLLLASPLAGALVLALIGHRRRAPEVNAAFSALTFAAAAALVARVVADGAFA